MLVVTRKADQQICIGRDIVVTVVRVKGGAVRIGIEAPPEVSIARGELVGAERTGHGKSPRRSPGAASAPPAPGRSARSTDDVPPGDPPPSGPWAPVSRAPRAERTAEIPPQPRVGPAPLRRRIRPIVERVLPAVG